MPSVEKYSTVGASRAQVKLALSAFVASDDFKVFAVKGTWGVGKTYLVKNFLKERRIDHFYGSAFGLGSLSQLKSQLIVNSKSFDNSDDDPYRIRALYAQFARAALRYRDILSRLPKAAAVFPITEELLFSTIKSTVVCIDDIERKSESLSMVGLLGFVSHLVEERSCKVIFVLNEERFSDGSGDQRDLDKYREKVVDAEVKLAPSFEENCEIVFDRDDPDHRTVLDCLSRAGVVNIRLMQRVSWIVREFMQHVREWEGAVRDQFLRNLTVIALARFDDQFPVDVSEFPYKHLPPRALDPDVEEQKEAWRRLDELRRIGYSDLPTDVSILDFVSNLAYDEEFLLREGARLNEREATNRILSSLRQMWRLYGESFAPNGAEINARMGEFLDNHLSLLDLHAFHELKILAGAVGKDLSDYETRLLKEKIDTCSRKHIEYLGPYVEALPELKVRLESRRRNLQSSKTITSVLLSVAEKRVWSRRDTTFLNERTEEDFEEWLLAGHADLPLMVQYGLEMGKRFSKVLKRAILNLANVDRLNRMRAEKLYHVASEDEAARETAAEDHDDGAG